MSTPARRHKPHSAGDTSLEYYARGLRVLHGAHAPLPNEPDAINPLLALALALACVRVCVRVRRPPLPTIARNGIAADWATE